MYNFFLNPATSQEEMNKYASDALNLAVTVGLPTAKACSGLKLSKGSVNIGKSSKLFNPNGTVMIAETAKAIPAVVLVGELAEVPSAYYAIATGSFIDACYGGGTGSGGDQSGSGSNKIQFPENPDDFNPEGLRKIGPFETKNGKIIKWLDENNKAVYEWDEDLTYGTHYHVIGEDGNTRLPNSAGETHFLPGDIFER